MRPSLEPILGRRGMLAGSFSALAGIGLLDLLKRDGAAGQGGAPSPWRPERGETHFPAKAKRVLQIFCPGAASVQKSTPLTDPCANHSERWCG